MGQSRTARTTGLILALALALGPAVASAQQAQGDGRDPRLDFAGKLIESSSAAKKVEASGNAEALQLREQARGLYQRALEAEKAGDQKTASEFLNAAIGAMQKAVKLSSPEDVTGPKQREDFTRFESSVGTLTDALGRIAAEKGVQGQITPVVDQVGRIRGDAKALFDAGKPVEAKAKLDTAYQLLKTNIEGLRGGEELTRSLNFANAKEEFDYEIDRNDTHQMLVQVFAEEKITSDSTRQRVQGFLDAALALRKEADGMAAGGDHKGAIGKLEESTKELIKAIRSAGLYIPG